MKPFVIICGLVCIQTMIFDMSDMIDFPVVLFRPNFMLLSEEHLMKTHKNQWLLSTLFLPAIPWEPRTKAHPMVQEVQTPSQ